MMKLASFSMMKEILEKAFGTIFGSRDTITWWYYREKSLTMFGLHRFMSKGGNIKISKRDLQEE